MELQEHFAHLRAISPYVEKFLDNKLYLMDCSEDDITPYQILTDCYLLIIDELKELGVRLTVDPMELLGDFYTAERLYHLRAWLDSNSLVQYFKSERHNKDAIMSILECTDIHKKEKIQVILDHLLDKHPESYEVNMMAGLRNELYSTIRLDQHIRAIVEQIHLPPVPLVNLSNMDKVALFMQQITVGRQDFEKVVHIVLNHDTSLDRAYLLQAIKLYDLEKVQPANLNTFTWAFLTDPTTLSPEMQQLQQQYKEQHWNTTSHHIEHYLVTPPDSLTKENLVELTCHHYEHDGTEERFRTAVETMIQKGTTLFTSEQIAYIMELTEVISTAIYHSQELEQA